MAETNAQRITQLESIVNELTARVAADSENMDLPPLLASAKTELADLQAVTAAADKAAADKAAADKAAADKAAADKAAAAAAAAADKAAAAAAADKAAADAKTVADAQAAAAAAPAPAPAPARTTFFRRAAPAAPAAPAAASIAITPLSPTVVPIFRNVGVRPNPAGRRPAPVAGTSRSGQ